MATVRSPPSNIATRSNNNNNSDLTTQCSQCKVIMNELLAFISNKVDTLPETGITQICLSAYTTEEIENARAIAYKLLAPTKKFLRRKEGSEQKCILEIIKLIKEFEPDCLPVFVAKNLNKLPAVSFDYIDITSFLKEMTLLKNDVARLKSKTSASTVNATSTSDIDDLKKEFENVKSMIKELRQTCNTRITQDDLFLRPYHDDKDKRNKPTITQSPGNVIVGPCELHIDAAGMSSGVSAVRGESGRGKRDGARAHPLASGAGRPALSGPPTLTPASAAPPRAPLHFAHAASTFKQLTADIDLTDMAATTLNETRKGKDDDGFTMVTRKKRVYRYRNERGTLQNTSKLQAAEAFAFVYLSRARKDTKEGDIIEHIKELNEECIGIEMLNQKRETNFNSFKITVLSSKLNKFLQKDFWPEGLVFRRYRQQRSSGNETASIQN